MSKCAFVATKPTSEVSCGCFMNQKIYYEYFFFLKSFHSKYMSRFEFKK